MRDSHGASQDQGDSASFGYLASYVLQLRIVKFLQPLNPSDEMRALNPNSVGALLGTDDGFHGYALRVAASSPDEGMQTDAVAGGV